MEELGRKAPIAETLGLRLIDRAILGEGNAVVLAGALAADEAAAHVPLHLLRIAIEGMAVTAAAAGLDAQDVAPAQDGAVAHGDDHALVAAAGIDHAAPAAAGLAAGDAPGRVVHGIDPDGEHRLLRQHLDL